MVDSKRYIDWFNKAEVGLKSAKILIEHVYLETRYPADVPMDINELEAQECIEIATSIIDRPIKKSENLEGI